MPAGAQLRTGISDDRFNTTTPGPLIRMTKTTGATVARLVLYWHDVAFAGEPTNPDDYYWDDFDRQVRAAANNGLEPLVTIVRAPPWAHDGGEVTTNPDAEAYGRFAEAAAKRYSGTWLDSGGKLLPRVRWWMAWNEPNRRYHLMPQFNPNGSLSSPTIYRHLVNAFADGVRGAPRPAGDTRPNLVIAGGLAPLGSSLGPAPLRFMRALLSQQVKFDVWSHHPYTSGGPTHKASGSGNVALGNLPTMRKLLNERFRDGKVLSGGKRPQFWITEFSWDTKPPDKHVYALPMKLHARWTSEALYRLWRQRIPVVVWWKVRDDPFSGKLGTPYQSGFYTVKNAQKRSFRAFRFPTVAFRRPGKILVWGRTPTSTSGNVVIQIRIGKRWRKLTTVRANGNGIFTRSIRTPYRDGVIRARYRPPNSRAQTSLGFSLTPVPNRYVNPFGCGGGLPCS